MEWGFHFFLFSVCLLWILNVFCVLNCDFYVLVKLLLHENDYKDWMVKHNHKKKTESANRLGRILGLLHALFSKINFSEYQSMKEMRIYFRNVQLQVVGMFKTLLYKDISIYASTL